MFMLIFLAQFYALGKTNGLVPRTTDYRHWSHTCRHGSPSASSGRRMTNFDAFILCTFTWLMVICRGDLAPLCVYYDLLLTVPHILLQYPKYDKDHFTFHLQGTLCDILGNDHGKISNIMAFLHGTGVPLIYIITFLLAPTWMLHVCSCFMIFIGLYTDYVIEFC
jgi:hypothetical protein